MLDMALRKRGLQYHQHAANSSNSYKNAASKKAARLTSCLMGVITRRGVMIGLGLEEI